MFLLIGTREKEERNHKEGPLNIYSKGLLIRIFYNKSEKPPNLGGDLVAKKKGIILPKLLGEANIQNVR